MVGKIHRVDFATDDKAIYCFGNVRMGLFFEPLNDNQTRVDYVRDGILDQATLSAEKIDLTIKEVSYLLKHGQQKYREYTKKMREQWDKEFEAESNKSNSLYD
jgi:hypothetical protein